MRLQAILIGCALAACSSGGPGSSAASGGTSEGLAALMKARKLSEADVQAALMTYTPSGRHDEYYLLASGGHSGQVVVIGVPSMRILKYIAVFTPEPWQGYGYGDQSKQILDEGKRHGHDIRWADTHHPALSETNADYDGKFLFIGDKANARVAVIDLRDFTTKQIVTTHLIESNHGAAFVTPNTEYVIEGTQYPAPLGGEYADVKEFKEKFRGAAVFWKFDRSKGRIDPERSFAIELPPYMQDLSDAGKGVSDGWAFMNSIDSELAYGGDMEGNVPLEAGASKNDMDYMHVINWRKAAEIVAAGKAETITGMKVIRLATAVKEGLLFFIPEPKSPHGVDIAPNGDDIVVGGKLDTHATVYSFAKIKALIDAGTFESRDPYGVPVLPFKQAIRGQVELGLGPLHSQFDAKGNVYTSLFLESVVARWNLKELKLVDKVSTHYNIGHLAAAEGDTVSPDGKYLVAMNKWALDRFTPVGPLLPQNFQLIDITGEKMRVVYDLPIPLGEPHYAQMIRADKLHPIDMYPPDVDPITDAKATFPVEGGKERIERRPDGVHVFMTAVRSHFTPDLIRVTEGDSVHIHITNLEQAQDATHGFAIDSYNISLSLEPGEHDDVDFVADRPGVFPLYCTEFCSALHLEMAGYFMVAPKTAT
ncbi:MAG TPA: Sec-dependent nitrous-oxide reductase, partial [Kofleriaceae bacterium]|nr:Sec-dependent nitrous-oxide reductase [Kofleriaceae bacterium]